MKQSEKDIYVQKFDMVKFESRVKELILDAVKPLSMIQQTQVKDLQTNTRKQNELDYKSA